MRKRNKRKRKDNDIQKLLNMKQAVILVLNKSFRKSLEKTAGSEN